MKRIFTLLTVLSVSFTVSAQSQYLGNRGTGFGGAIGQSSLTISEDATRIYFNLVRGSGNFSDALVIYVDAVANGYTTTSGFVDAGDPSRTAISGYSYADGSGNRLRSVLNFPSNFAADYAIAVAPSNNFAGLYILNSGGNHTYVEDAALQPVSNPSNANYTFSVIKTSLGLTVPATFKFVGTYLNSGFNVFRSNEGYGIASAIANPGYNTLTAANFLTYPSSTILPVRLLSFAGSVVDSKGKLTWQVANDDEISKYEIEKSTNGKDFSALQAVSARHTTAVQSYTIEDAKLSGTNYYRLKTTDLQNVVTYSKIVQLSIGVKGQGFTIFPNPVMQTLNIKTAKLEKGQYDVNVYSASGQLVFAKAIQYDGSGNTIQVELPANMQKGNYNCILNSATGKFASSFLKQ